MTKENQGLLLGAIGVTTFALTLPATRALVEYMNPVFIGLGRSFFASILAITILAATRQPWPTTDQLRRAFYVALGVVFGFPVLSAIAMQSLPAAHGGVILAILPLATVACSVLITNERPSVGFWIFSILGSLLVVAYSILKSDPSEDMLFGMGDILLVLAVLSAAAGYAIGGKLANEIGGWQVICWALAVAFPLLFYPVLFGVAPAPHHSESLSEIGITTFFSTLNSTALVCFFYLILMSQLIGFFFWYKGLAMGGVARVSQLQLLQPFITIAASAWLLHEMIDATTIWFAVAVVMVVAAGKRTAIHKSG